MTTKIEQKIIGYKVKSKEEATEQAFTDLLETTVTEETIKPLDSSFKERIEALKAKASLKRPLRLDNEWRLKPPYAEHALYVRLNAIELEGKKYPYEIFFNTKDVTQVEWINALTLTLSIAFRTAIETGTSLQPLIDNLKETFGTRGSYLSKVPTKPKFVNGLVAEIGYIIEVFNNECLTRNARSDSPRVEKAKDTQAEILGISSIFGTATGLALKLKEAIEESNPCPECGEQLTKVSGCDTCTSCYYSKCG